MTIVCCEFCGNQLCFKKNQIKYAVELSQWQGSCATCFASQEKKQIYSFCSLSCFRSWVENVTEHVFPAYRRQAQEIFQTLDQASQQTFSLDMEKTEKKIKKDSV